VVLGRSSVRRSLTLALGSLGVVFGDIGTDPLFSLKACFGEMPGGIAAGDVLGVLSLILWAMIGIVCIKYLTVLFRADNQGEGGILALVALSQGRLQGAGAGRIAGWAIALGLFGAGLLFADAVVTPAISVLSAVEGLKEVSPALTAWVIPVTVAILVGVFVLQPSGAGRIGTLFGPVMIVWFLVVGGLGIPAIVARPEVWAAANPVYAVHYLLDGGWHAFLALGGVVLTIAGVEALYADMGHFGKGPIRLAWYAVVMPSLVLNYLGQGALVLERGASALQNPFYGLVPAAGLVPMIVLATASTVIASQSLISGTFSLAEHAIQLGYLPPWRILHTSSHIEGQIYVPVINWSLMTGVVGLVLAVQDSETMGGMYGMSVIGAMFPVSILFYLSAREALRWSRLLARTVVIAFLAVDGAMLAASVPRLAHGAWVPVAIGVGAWIVMLAWRAGTAFEHRAVSRTVLSLAAFVREADALPRVHGGGIFFADGQDVAPPAVVSLATLKGALLEVTVIVSIETDSVPTVAANERLRIGTRGKGIHTVLVRRGFMDRMDGPQIAAACAERGIPIDPATCRFWLNRAEVVSSGRMGIATWYLPLFALLRRTSVPLALRWNLPPDRVTEIGVEADASTHAATRIRRF
jgi:KUP system potassium uptake protein